MTLLERRWIRVGIRTMHEGKYQGGVAWYRDVTDEDLEQVFEEALAKFRASGHEGRIEISATPPTIAGALTRLVDQQKESRKTSD